MANTKTQFRHTTVQMNDTKSGRWYELKDWKLENQVKNGKVTTAACYDGYKNGDFTVATGLGTALPTSRTTGFTK